MSYDPAASPIRSKGRPVNRPSMTERAAQKAAAQLMTERPPSPELYRVLSVLATGGVLTEAQIMAECDVKDRVLCNYVQRHLLDKVPLREYQCSRLERVFGKSPHTTKVYTLGVLGHALAPYLAFDHVPTGYKDVKVDRVTHDVFCNEVVLYMMRAARRYGYAATWHNKYAATVRGQRSAGKDRAGKEIFKIIPLIEPDAMMVLSKDGVNHRYLIEYHNDDNKRRAAEKVALYEKVFKEYDHIWPSAWGCQVFPRVLCVFTYKAPGYGYLSSLLERHPPGSAPRGELDIQWCGRRLAQLLRAKKPFSEWVNLLDGTLTDI